MNLPVVGDIGFWILGVAAVLEQMPAVQPDAFTGTGCTPESRKHLFPSKLIPSQSLVA